MRQMPHLLVAVALLSITSITSCTGTIDGSGPTKPNGGDPGDPGSDGDGDQGGPGGPDNGGDMGNQEQPPTHLDYLHGLPKGAEQRASVCARGNQDRFALWYCNGPAAPTITGLNDILVGLRLKDPQNLGAMRFVLTSHSSSLVTRSTSVLNPRAIIFTPDNTADYLALGYVRGDDFVEIAAFDQSKADLNFYLLRFDRACEFNCTNAERFTAQTETGWKGLSAYFEADIGNTALDCRQCHQPGGANAKRILRMQELQEPWTHFFRDEDSGLGLLQTFTASHPGEDYAGIPANRIANADTDPEDLEDFLRAKGFGNQPNEFEGENINNDDLNVTTPNNVWLGLYREAIAGRAISPPYFGIRPWDEAKVTAASTAYRAVAAGNAGPETLPNMVDLFLDSAKAYLGFTAADGLDAVGIVQHRCGTCHDGRFPGVSRDNLRVANFPNNLAPEMKAKIKERLHKSSIDRLRMPPIVFSELTPAQISAIEAALDAAP
jgi:hypothetical protein